MTLAQTKPDYTAEQVDLIKQTVAAGTTDLELALFLEVARSTGLNPFQRQIYAIKRKSGRDEKMTIQTGIDGYRLIAARSGVHLGTTDPEFGPTKDGYPEWARVIVRKLVAGQVAEFPATARWSEYVQQKDEWVNNQRTGKKTVTDMWAKMPHTMLGKCAEALALRKAFPAELSGVYSDVEMQQADIATPVQVEPAAPAAQEPQEGPSKNEQAITHWGNKSDDLVDRITDKYGEKHGVALQAIYDRTRWYESAENAQRCYEEVKAFGLMLAAKAKDVAPAPQDVGSDTPDTMATPEQIKALQSIARTAGATTSDQRAVLWGHMVNHTSPLHTKELTAEQAQFLLDTCEGLDIEGRKQTYAEAQKAAQGRLV